MLGVTTQCLEKGELVLITASYLLAMRSDSEHISFLDTPHPGLGTVVKSWYF